MNIKEAITIIAGISGIIVGMLTINNYISSDQSQINLSPTTGYISISSFPSDASIYIDGIYNGTTPTTLKNIDQGSHTITLKYMGYQDWSSTIYVVADQTILVSTSLTPITMPAPPSTAGSISVSSSPSGASIYLDGSYKGTTPMTIKNIEGSHTITLNYTGYQDWSWTIYAVAGQTIPVSASLTPVTMPVPSSTTGSISVSSSPSGSSIYLNGNYEGTTPMTIENVEISSHTITLKYPGYQDWSSTIDVIADKTISVSTSLIPIAAPATAPSTTGSISVSSSPSGASIYLDGSYKGTTPMTIEILEKGSYTITLKHTFYPDWSNNINVRAGETTHISANLKRPAESTLSEDAILNYRIVSQSKIQLTIDVDYTYNIIHGEEVYIGADLYYRGNSIGAGYIPEIVPTVESGTARITITAPGGSGAQSDELEVFLHEPDKGPFIRRTFHFEAIWEPSK